MAFPLKLVLKFLSSECPSDQHQKVSVFQADSSRDATTAGCNIIKVQTVKALISY